MALFGQRAGAHNAVFQARDNSAPASLGRSRNSMVFSISLFLCEQDAPFQEFRDCRENREKKMMCDLPFACEYGDEQAIPARLLQDRNNYWQKNGGRKIGKN